MLDLSDSDLEHMLSDLEADWVERKESFKGDSPNNVREAVCAFANDLPNNRRAGVAFIGSRSVGAVGQILSPRSSQLSCGWGLRVNPRDAVAPLSDQTSMTGEVPSRRTGRSNAIEEGCDCFPSPM
jgi:hypothetical protein